MYLSRRSALQVAACEKMPRGEVKDTHFCLRRNRLLRRERRKRRDGGYCLGFGDRFVLVRKSVKDRVLCHERQTGGSLEQKRERYARTRAAKPERTQSQRSFHGRFRIRSREGGGLT